MRIAICINTVVLLLLLAISGCSDPTPPRGREVPAPPMSDVPTADLRLRDEIPPPDVAPPQPAKPVEASPRKTVLESLYQAVRNGAANALEEQAREP